MFIAPASRIRLRSCFVPLACSLAFLACGSATVGGGTGGQGATGTGGGSGGSSGTGGSHTGGTTGTGGVTGSGGTTGTGGSNPGTGGSNTGTGGSNTGTGGTTGSGGTGTGGSNTGTGGVTGSGGSGTGGSATGGAGGKGGQAGGAGGSMGGSSGFVCPSGMSSPSASAIPAGSSATKIAGAPPSDSFNNNGNNFTNVEGPVWIGSALYFSEMTSGTNPPPSRILKIDSSDAVTQFYPSGGGGDSGSNGMAVDANGNLVTANHGVGGIVSFSIPGGTKTTIISSFGGKRFNSPNDLTIRNDGTIYFTDPSFQAPSPSPQPNTGVYMVPPGASPTATELISNLSNPNGVALSLDQKTLYVGHGGGVYSYAVNTDGTIGTTATHVDASNLDNNATDGMAIDCAGDLYVVRVNTHDIDVVSFGGNPGSAGTHLSTIGSIPGGGQLTNVAFGGSDHKTLYITVQGSSQHGVYKLTMPIPGMPY